MIPSEGDTVDTTVFARSLMLVISERVLRAEAERRFGLVFTEEDIAAKVDELVVLSGQTEEDILTNYNLTESSLRSIGAQQLLADRVIAELVAAQPGPSEEELMARYEAMLPSVTQVCSSHILLRKPRRRGGNPRGGPRPARTSPPSLSSCPSDRAVRAGAASGVHRPPATWRSSPRPVQEAELGVPYGPVETQFGWHVILVTDRLVPGFEDVRDQIVAEIRAAGSEDLWIAWLTDSLAAADVEVEAEIRHLDDRPGAQRHPTGKLTDPLIVAGLGPGTLDQTPADVMEVLLDPGFKVILRTVHHPSAAQLAERRAVTTCDDLYESAETFEEVYDGIVDRVLAMAEEGPVVYAVPGSPLYGERIGRRTANPMPGEALAGGAQGAFLPRRGVRRSGHGSHRARVHRPGRSRSS